ncbi:threonine--tRNA ligase, partial [Candidatus Riesia pediculischaeffi]|uniref:Threonine--tRNA ligase n=1 Tax=Candidatus Riesia pediculischaeffi PTSU TaxID=1401651 RepID=A0A0C1S0A8_9ENTR
MDKKIPDHRKIGKQMNLFCFDDTSPGNIFWNQNGLIIFQELKKYVRSKLKKYEYQEVKTPTILNESLWKNTGHLQNYEKNMFKTNSESNKYCLKPMNCPGHIKIFGQKIRSYKDLPLRIAEFGSCYRNELSGSLHGLMRVREFTQDDAHIFCTEEQVFREIRKCIEMVQEIYKTFEFKKVSIKLATRPKQRIGDERQWDRAESILERALEKNFDFLPENGAFYGPKIEFTLHDKLGREWQCGTIQLDFLLPIKLGISYINEKNERIHPMIIHRAVLGSIERFIGILIEHCDGHFPTWLSPIQVVVINVSKKYIEFSKKIVRKIRKSGIRVEQDLRNEKINFKIRQHSFSRVPYIILCGREEERTGNISIREQFSQKIVKVPIEDFIRSISSEIKNYFFKRRNEY